MGQGRPAEAQETRTFEPNERPVRYLGINRLLPQNVDSGSGGGQHGDRANFRFLRAGAPAAGRQQSTGACFSPDIQNLSPEGSDANDGLTIY